MGAVQTTYHVTHKISAHLQATGCWGYWADAWSWEPSAHVLKATGQNIPTMSQTVVQEVLSLRGASGRLQCSPSQDHLTKRGGTGDKYVSTYRVLPISALCTAVTLLRSAAIVTAQGTNRMFQKFAVTLSKSLMTTDQRGSDHRGDRCSETPVLSGQWLTVTARGQIQRTPVLSGHWPARSCQVTGRR